MTNKAHTVLHAGAIRSAPPADLQSLNRKNEGALMQTLRVQVDSLGAALKKAEDDNRRLNTAIASREQELSRSTKLMSIVSSNYVDSADAGSLLPSNRTDQLLAADVANKRTIDQLNGQVDFLNEQLAQREEQLVRINDKLLRFDAVQTELSQR